MSLSQFATARPVTILMVVAGVLLFGAIAFNALGLDLLPDLSLPMNAIVTIYPNADAETIERAVTAKVEDAISTVNNLKRVTSMSYENISLVLAEFDWGVDLAGATQEITVALETLHYTLPSAAQKPLVMQFDPSQIPISLIGLSSDVLSVEELTRLAEEEVIPVIERTPGVARTSVSGGVGRVVSVMYDSAKLQEIGISESLLAQMIAAQNVFVPIGPVYDGGKRYAGKVGMEIDSIDELKRLVVGVSAPEETGVGSLLGMSFPSPVYLEDVAEVTMTRSEVEGITRVNGRTGLLITVMKRSGENTVLVSERIEQALGKVSAKLDQAEIHFITDQARFIRRSINNLSANGIAGALIAAAVLFAFLKRMSSTLIIALAIPLSVMSTFILMHLSGLTLNLMTLGGLALGVGMLVDNSIVVLESIHRHREMGRPPGEASVQGASKVTSAIAASTLTTIAVFLPVVFLKSFAGHLFTELSLTVSFSLLSSLLVALTVVPAMASRARWNGASLASDHAHPSAGSSADSSADSYAGSGAHSGGHLEAHSDMHSGGHWEAHSDARSGGHSDARSDVHSGAHSEAHSDVHSEAHWPHTSAVAANAGLTGLTSRYRRILEWSLDHKWAVLAVSLLLFIVSLIALTGLETELLPDMDMGMVAVDVVLPPGTPVEETSSIVSEVESVLQYVPGIHTHSSQVGSAADASSSLSVFSALSSNRGRLDIMLKRTAERELSTAEVVARISSALEPLRVRHPHARIEVRATDQLAYATGLDQSALTINIMGDDFEILKQLSNELADRLESIEGIAHIEQSAENVQPVAFLDINHARALTSRMTAAQVGLSVRSQLLGTTATELRQDGELIPVILMSKDAVSKDLESVMSLDISSYPQTAAAGNSGGFLSTELASLITSSLTLGRVTTLRQEMEPTAIMRTDSVRTVTIDAYTSGIPLGTAQSLVAAEVDKMHIPEGYAIQTTGTVNIMQESLDTLKIALLMALVLVYMVMAAQFESLMSPFIVMFSVPLAVIGSVIGLRLVGCRFGVMSLVGIIVLVGIVVNNAILMVDSINRLRRRRRDLRSAILEAGVERLRPILMTATTTIVGLLPLAIGMGKYIGFGEATETQVPLAVTVMGGLLTSTLLTLVVIPAIYELIHGWLVRRSKARRRPIPSMLVIICFALIGTLVACGTLSSPAAAANPSGIGGSIPSTILPWPLRLFSLDFRDANIGFGFVHAQYDPEVLSFPSLANLLVIPEVKLQTSNTVVVAGLGVSVQYNPSTCMASIGVTGSAKITKRRMVKFGVFRDEILAVSYQWLPGRIPGGADDLAIAGRNDTNRAGAIALAAGVEMAVGRVALTTLASYASPTFDVALARAAHEFSVVHPGTAGLHCTVRWHQHTSVATIARGGLTVDLERQDITYLVTGGVYGSPLSWLDYSVLIGAEAGIRGITPVVDLQVTYKNFLRSGSRLILEIHNETGLLSASLRAKWPLQ